ncbi:MAG: alpha/beta hydrolase, partial [Betaproteobacteria bacterium]|nr:alpha/beta hydrolase [Betaproteobacteria bacterium]
MTPLRLDPLGRDLFALHQPAAAGARRHHGVLICNPFGQEAIRAHRFLRVLSERLSASGFDVLRFDYFGTGDSAGTEAEADLDTWVRDIGMA